MDTSNRDRDVLRAWHTPVRRLSYPGNLQVYSRGLRALEVAIEDLEAQLVHIFMFKGVLGYRFEDVFNAYRGGVSFIVENSAWVDGMSTKPFRTLGLEHAKQYKLSCPDGELDIVAVELPRYISYPKEMYRPLCLHVDAATDIVPS